MEFSGTVGKKVVEIAEEIKAAAIITLTETGETFDAVIANSPKVPVIATTANEETFQILLKKSTVSHLDIEFLDNETKDQKSAGATRAYAIRLLTRESTRLRQIEDAVVVAINKGILKEGDIVIGIGSTLNVESNSIFIFEVKKENLGFTLHDVIREANIKQEVLEAVLNIAIEIGREGREGRLIGTAFLIGDSKNVLAMSRQLIINPFEGHIIGDRVISAPEITETIKELAQLDGVFIVTEDGVIEAAGRYLNIDASKVDIPRGLGARHAAVAAVTMVTKAVGITVSQSGGIVRIFQGGKAVMTVEPQRRISLIKESLTEKLR